MRVANTLWSSVALFGMIVGAACGGATPEAGPPPGPGPAPAPAAPEPVAQETPAPAPSAAPAPEPPKEPAKPTWKDMSFEQRQEFMKTSVQPKMAELFQGVDAKKYKDMNCATCHGKGAKQGKFKMPNPDLPKLDPKDGFKKHMDKKPDITKFMMQQVTPTMATTLGVPPYDPATQSGFGCGACHLIAGAK